MNLKMRHRFRVPALLAGCGALLMLSACGLVETTATTAAGAQSEVEAAKNAKATEDEFKRRLDAAQQTAAAQRAQAEAQSSDISAADPN